MPLNTGSISTSRLLRKLRVLAPNPLKIRNRLLVTVTSLIPVQGGRIRIPQSLTQRLISATDAKNSALLVQLRLLQTLIQVRNIVSSLTASLRQVLLRLARVPLGASQLLLRSRNLLSPIGGGTRRTLLRLLQLAGIAGTPGPGILGRLQPRTNSLKHALRTDRDSRNSASRSSSQRRNRGQKAKQLSHRRQQGAKSSDANGGKSAQNDPGARNQASNLLRHASQYPGNPGHSVLHSGDRAGTEHIPNPSPSHAQHATVNIDVEFNLVPARQFPRYLGQFLPRRYRISVNINLDHKAISRP